MGNKICITENKVVNEQSPQTNWRRTELHSGSVDRKCIRLCPIETYKNSLANESWERALNNSDFESLKKCKNFRELVMLGPPEQYRWKSWKYLLQGHTYDYNIRPSKDAKSILKDIDRTLVNQPLFKEGAQIQLERILMAATNAMPQLGYCQGMNFIVAMLLIVSNYNEREAFQSFMQVLVSPDHIMFFMYSNEMPLHTLMVKLIHGTIKRKYPQLSRKLRGIPDSLWITKLILTMFIYVFPLSDCVRVWDYLIARGIIRGIPELVLGIVEIMYDDLLTFEQEDFGLQFNSYETATIKLNVGDVIFAAKQNNGITKRMVAKVCQKIPELHMLQKYENPIYEKLVRDHFD